MNTSYPIYYVDGFNVGSNPSLTGGYTITDNTGKILLREILKGTPDSLITCNEAEFRGLCKAIELAEPHSTIYTDSQNNINWLNLGFPKKSKRKDLIPLARQYNELYIAKSLNIVWTKRDDNLAGIQNEDNPM